MSPFVAQLPLPPALDALVCSLIGGVRTGAVSEATFRLIVEQLHQATWYARCSGGVGSATAQVDLAVATERLSHALSPKVPA